MSTEHALKILDELSKVSDTRSKRKTQYLTSLSAYNVKASNAEKLKSDWCKEWVFKPHFAMADSLDIKVTPIIESSAINTIALNTGVINPKKKPVKYYTQGNDFYFEHGYTIYDCEAPYIMKWGEALEHIKQYIEIEECTRRNNANPDGNIKFWLFTVKDKKIKKPSKTLSMDLNEFIKFLIIGE